MLKARLVRPGLATNEELAALGPEAEILFVRLWMLADREGRLEDRPARIKAEAIPYYNWDVENLLENLSKSGFIIRYKGAPEGREGAQRGAMGLIQVVNFRKHQPIHPHEAKSTLPPPPPKQRKHKKSVKTSTSVMSLHAATSNGKSRRRRDMSGPILSLPLLLPNGVAQSEEAVPRDVQETSPTLTRNTTENAERKPPARETAPRRPDPVDFEPYLPEDVQVVRESLNQLSPLVHLPQPDDGIVRQVLDVCRGAPGIEIHGVLRKLYLDRKLASMRSWGLIPIVLRPWFERYRPDVRRQTVNSA